MKKPLILFTACMAAMTIVSTSCKKSADDPAPAAAPSLYTRVGGTALKADPNNAGQMIQTGRFTLRAVTDSSIYVIAEIA